MTMASTSDTGLAKYMSSHASFQNPDSSTSPLPALYSDLSRQRKSNPAGYRASVEWWKDVLLDVTFRGLQFDHDPPALISAAASTSTSTGSGSASPAVRESGEREVMTTTTTTSGVDRTVFRLDESTKARWTVARVGRPLGLGTVLSDLEADHTAVSLSTFCKATKPVALPSSLLSPARAPGVRSYLPTPTAVASTLLLTPVKLLGSTLLSLATGGGSHDDDGGEEDSRDEQLFRAKRGDWVLVPLLERLCSTFLTHFYATEASASLGAAPLACLMTREEFAAKLGEACSKHLGFVPSARDAHLTLLYMARDRAAPAPGVATESDLVKLAATEHQPVAPITSEDRSLLTVKSTLSKLDSQISSLSSQIAQRTASIQRALRSHQKPQALAHLRSRKALQQVLDKRQGVRDTLAAVLDKIEQAHTDLEVVRALQAGEEVLGSVLGRRELRLDEVERVMESLGQLGERQQAVEDALNGGAAAAVGEVDDDEVMHELRRLEDEAKRQLEQSEQHARHKEELQRPQEEQDKQKEKEKATAEREKQQHDNDDLQARLDRLRVSTAPLATPPPTGTNTNTSPILARDSRRPAMAE